MFVPKYTKRRTERRTRGPQTFCQTERGPLIPSDVSLSHNYMATGWDLSCWNIIRNVPLSLCEPSYTLLSSPLSALSSFLAPSSSAFFLLAYSLWQQTFPGGFSGHMGWGRRKVFWARCPAPVLALPSCSLSTDPQSERVRESDGKTYQNTQAASSTALLWSSVACNRSIS